ncbi:hypothetical protein [Anaerotignum sp.]|uniref:hypothetical protein n=1 Tax=Anaerotignum sp. TaxID=2039241 RepID=UPI0028A59D8B|nr:hypothetical protein [Anaerotignum sp.]
MAFLNFKVDMIRMVTKVTQDNFNTFYMRYVPNNPCIKSYLGYKKQDYHYNLAVDEMSAMAVLDFETGVSRIPNNRFYVGYQHNQETLMEFGGKPYNMVIEFNPNKCDVTCGLLNTILKKFFNDVHIIRVVSADFCCDVPDIPLDNVTIDMGRRRSYCEMRKNGGRGFYIGTRGSNGNVKIYDKAKELGLENKILTRYECHLAFDDLYADMIMGRGFCINDCLPTVYFDSGQMKLIEDVKLRCCVMAVKNGYADIKEFNPRFREKIKPYLEDTAKLIIDNSALKAIRETIITYFFDYCKELNLHY